MTPLLQQLCALFLRPPHGVSTPLCGRRQVVEKCHELGILHGDLKPANFVLADRTRNPLFSNDINLLFGEPWLLAIDFGCSQYLGSQRFTKRTGTPGE